MGVGAFAPHPQEMWYVYFIQNGRQSYIGYTVNLQRRFRQHLGLIRGGAKYTGRWSRPEDTRLICYFGGFESARQAMSMEWHCKRRNQRAKRVAGHHPRLPAFVATRHHPKFDVCPLTLYWVGTEVPQWARECSTVDEAPWCTLAQTAASNQESDLEAQSLS